MGSTRWRMAAAAATVAVMIGALAGTAAAAGLPPIATMPAGSSAIGSLVGVRADDGAVIVAQKWLDRRTVDVTIRSPAVGTSLPVRVIVPVGWTQAAARTWPLAMMLHGGQDDYTSWTRETDIEKLSASWGVLVAMPEAGLATAYTDYFQKNTTLGPLQWETFHTTELVQILQRGFRAGPRRAIAGLSSGGLGAMDYTARHPGEFAFAGSYSGVLFIRQAPVQQALLAFDAYQGAAFARYGVPILDEANWRAHDPYLLEPKLRGVSLFVSSGLTGIPSAQDTVGWSPEQFGEAVVGQFSIKFANELRARGIPVTTSFPALGEHAWAGWQAELHRSWPQMMTAIGARQA